MSFTLKLRVAIIIILYILQIIKARNSKAPKITISFPDVGDKDFQNETVAIMTNSNPVFEMLCMAPYPVEWIFHYTLEDDGTSEETKLVETRRHAYDFTDVSSFSYSSSVRLGYRGKILSLTNFTCTEALPWDLVVKDKAKDGIPLQTHVIMTAENQKSLIVLKVTTTKPELPIIPSDSTNLNANCDRAIAITAQEPGYLMPCWRCESSTKELELDYNYCISPSQCRSIFSRENLGTKCMRQMKTHPENCKGINPDFNPKIVLCKNLGPALAQFFFFGIYRGELDDESVQEPPVYHSWSDSDPQQMIYVHPISREVVYVDEEIIFTCEYSRYYFALGSWFGIESNGSIHYVKAVDQKPCDFDAEKTEMHIRNCTLDESWRGTYMAKLTTSFQNVGFHQVYCMGPVWNSTEWINASESFYVENGEPPSVVSLQPDNKNEFIVGQRRRQLVCKYSGKPVPLVTWEASNNQTQFHIRPLDNYTSAIEFYEIGFQTAGTYSCIVSSYLGNDTKTFFLDSHAEKGAILSTGSIVGISVSVLLVFIVIILVILRMVRIIQIQREELRILTEAEVNEFLEGNPSLLKNIGNDFFSKASAIEALPYDKNYEIPADNLIIDYSVILGSGAYGMVLKGKLTSATDLNYINRATSYVTIPEELPVAIKVSKGSLDVANFKALLTEIKVMAYLGSHENIVSLIGASTQEIKNRELYIAVEYCENGSLDNFIRKHKSIFDDTLSESTDRMTSWNLLKWTCHTADGLEYIHSKRIIHADLAIRNILLTADLTAKIGDFGLSRQLVESSSYTKTTKCALPWRNMAIESLKCLEFSVKSDMWAFGVMLWEIFTLGDVPYPGLSYTVEFTNLLEQGLRLYKPPFASNSIYDYLLLCWSTEPTDRPGPGDVKAICTKLMNASV